MYNKKPNKASKSSKVLAKQDLQPKYAFPWREDKKTKMYQILILEFKKLMESTEMLIIRL